MGPMRRNRLPLATALVGLLFVAVACAGGPPDSVPPLPVLVRQNPTVVDPVVVAAGDVACAPGEPLFSGSDPNACQMRATANLIVGVAPDYLLPLGDNQYPSKSAPQGTQPSAGDYQNSYNKTWGTLQSQVPGLIVRPVPGNHEYGANLDDDPPLAPGSTYYDNFGPRGLNQLPPGVTNAANDYFSYDIPVNGGTWHVIALDSECRTAVGGCQAGSAQETWLRNDLAAHPSTCTLAYWHEPRWSAISPQGGGQPYGNQYAAFWNDLVAARATLVLNAHEHIYEHLGPMDADGNQAPRGLSQFIVGTGGEDHEGVGVDGPSQIYRNDHAFGVLKLTLHAAFVTYAFQGTDGLTVDKGSIHCPAL